MNKPNCYNCKHRGDLVGDCHSSCEHPEAQNNARKAHLTLNVIGNKHGINNGWFIWPWNFDPIWLERCDGFQAVENTETTPEAAQEAE